MQADDPDSSCGDPWMETGKFEFTTSAGVSGNTLTLFVPADFEASSYQVTLRFGTTLVALFHAR